LALTVALCRNRHRYGSELNLTWLDELPAGNEVVDGEWFDDSDALQVSVAQGLAERVGIKVGDTLSFLINSQTIEAKVTSLRSVNWGSLKPNFVMIFNDKIAGQFPVTYFTAAKLGIADTKVISQFLKAYPTISMIDIQSQLKQAQSMISQVSLAISFVLSIVLISGSLVLISQVQASLAERMQEIVILRTLGAKGRLIKLATLYEFLLLGGLAGLVAAVVSDIALLVIQVQTFDVDGRLHPYIWLLGPATGATFVAVIGYFMVANTMKQNTQGLLRKLA
jgi:putative ABC transport system permease protein